MKDILSILFISTILLAFSAKGYTLRQEETDEIFTQANVDNDNTLEGDEIQTALGNATIKLFEKAQLFKDEGLIKALASEFSKECSEKLTKEGFKEATNKLYSFAKNFRENAYKEIIARFEMHEVLKDQDLLEEVMRKPDVYGITYGSKNDVLDEIEKIYKETADVLKDIQRQFQELLEKTKVEGNAQAENTGKPVEVVDVPSEGTDQVKKVIQGGDL